MRRSLLSCAAAIPATPATATAATSERYKRVDVIIGLPRLVIDTRPRSAASSRQAYSKLARHLTAPIGFSAPSRHSGELYYEARHANAMEYRHRRRQDEGSGAKE